MHCGIGMLLEIETEFQFPNKKNLWIVKNLFFSHVHNISGCLYELTNPSPTPGGKNKLSMPEACRKVNNQINIH
jgi:hypothetical protein